MKETQEQLNKLIRNFFDESAARQVSRDIEEADRMMNAFGDPQLRDTLPEQIKKRMIQRAASLPRRRISLRLVLSAAAACLLIGVGLFWIQAIQNSRNLSVTITDLGPDVMQDFFTDQPVEEITLDLDEVSMRLYAVDAGEDSLFEEELETIEEIEEMDLLTDNNFWKG